MHQRKASLSWPSSHWSHIEWGPVNVDSCTPFPPLILLSFCLALYLFQDATPLQTIPLQTLICACRTYKKTWSASIGHPDNCVFSLVAPPSEASLVKFCRAFKVWVLVDQSWKASVVSHWSGNHWGDGGIGHESPRYTGFSFQLNLTRLRPMWFYRCLSCLRRTSSVSDTQYCLSGWIRPRIVLQFNVNPPSQQAMLLLTFFE